MTKSIILLSIIATVSACGLQENTSQIDREKPPISTHTLEEESINNLLIDFEKPTVSISVYEDGYIINSFADVVTLKSDFTILNGPIENHLKKYLKEYENEKLEISVDGNPELRSEIVEELTALKDTHNIVIVISEPKVRARIKRIN